MAIGAMAAAFAACGGASVEPTPVLTEPTAPESSGEDIVAVLATSDIAVGDNRIVFGLIEPGRGGIKDAEVVVQTFLITDQGIDGPKQTAEAKFITWPGGIGGVFVVHLSFDEPGPRGLGIVMRETGGEEIPVSATIEVQAESLSPAIGSQAPASESKTAKNASDLPEVTTDLRPDLDLYTLTVKEALASPVPLLVTFASPAYCQTATCGPQVDVVKDLKDNRSGSMNFIHIEVFDNPTEIEGDLTRAKISPTMEEWGLVTEPWTFVMDGQGAVRAKFEGFVTAAELEAAIAEVAP
ncbi:MAG: hypothetical protein FI707_11020 [SAR202 cluster bacterium]|nr:hypothetical protein [Chloroflexota bacterium]MDP6420852.1 hypothetical protein [SAR202 cluster bacterium]MQG69308.1 hypothetical protein [SAR202 cluster bacterium]